MKRILLTTLTLALCLSGTVQAQLSKVNFSEGRIAFSSDGNQHDKDDWGATAMSLAMLHYAGLGDKLVHYDFSDHMGNSNRRWEAKMIESAIGGALRFNIDPTKFFNNQQAADAAVDNFKAEAMKSSKDDPLWFICAGPMEMPWRCLNAVPKENLKYIYCISHSTWNEKHNDALNKHTWEDMKKDFPEVTYYDIIDQNGSDGVDDFNSPDHKWFWLKNSDNPDWQWLYEIDDKKSYDVSDAGMTWWLITGGPNGGDDKGGWPEMQALFKGTESLDTAQNNGLIIIEAESTESDLDLWTEIKEGDPNFVHNTRGTHIEFTANTKNGGSPKSPLAYTFTAPADGMYQLTIRCRKRLEGEPGDKCNDGWVKMEGDFESGNEIPVEDLKDYEKFFGGSELVWGWGNKLDWQGHIKRDALYKLKKGETYTFTMAGRSIRWNVDCIIFFNTENYSLKDVQSIIDPSSIKQEGPMADWNTKVKGFVEGYVDKGREAIAINTTQQPTNEWGAAQKIYKGESGTYTLKFTSLLETDGECSYRVKINGKKVLEFTNPRIHGTDVKEYSKHVEAAENVSVKKGDLIQVEYLSNSNNLVPEGSGFGYARARWQGVEFVK